MWTWLLVSGCQYFSCQCLWLPVSVASFSGCQYLSCQCLGCRVLQLLVPLHQLPVSRLLVPKLPVPLPRLPVSAGACWCLGWCPGSVPWLPRISPSQLLRTVVRRLSRIPMSHQHRCPVSRPSSPQTTTGQVISNTKNVMKI